MILGNRQLPSNQTANVHYSTQIVKHLYFDSERCLLATVGQDNVIKIWKVKEVLEAGRMAGP